MNTLLGFPETRAFGPLLRQWRLARHLSQLALATEAGISTRHLSFLETGRAQPSREMVQLLGSALDEGTHVIDGASHGDSVPSRVSEQRRRRVHAHDVQAGVLLLAPRLSL